MVANAEGTTPGAGWFADPAGSPYLRWWDGSQWTDNFIDAKTGAPPGELPAAPSAPAEPTPAASSPESTNPAASSNPAATSNPAESSSPAATTTPEVVPSQVEPEPVVQEPVVAEPVVPEPVAQQTPSPESTIPATPEPTPVAPASAFAPGSPYAPVIPGAYVPEVPKPVVAPADVPVEPVVSSGTVSQGTVSQGTEEPGTEEPGTEEPAPAAFDAGPAFPEQTSPVGPQLTRRQARIMQEMEEARGNQAAAASVEADSASASAATPIPPALASEPAVVQPAVAQPPVVQPPVVQPPLVQTPEPQAPFVQPAAVQPPVAPAAELPVQTPIVPPPTPAPMAQPPAAQEPVVVPLATPPTPFDATTVAPPSVPAPTPAAWPFAAAPDATTAVPLAAADSAASATPWLNAPAPSPDAVLPAEQTAYEPMARPRSQAGTAQEVFVGTTNNWAIWVFAALPILHLAIIWYIYTSLQPAFDSPIRWAVLLGPIVFYILLAAVDLSILKRNGHVNLPSVLLAIIPLLYLGIRSARLGVRTLPPLVVWILLQAGAVIALMLVFPTIYSQLTSAADPTPTSVAAPVVATTSLTSAQRAAELTPTGMASEITKQLAAKNVTLKSVTCPPLQSTQDAVTVTCVGSVDDGTSLNIVVAVDSSNKTSAFDIVSSGPAS